VFSTLVTFKTSRQGNNEEQAHTRNKGTNEHDWKETAISLETIINTWGWPIKAETCSDFKDFKSDKCWEHWKVFLKLWQAAQKTERKSESESEIVFAS
jgi:hypothetical protein